MKHSIKDSDGKECGWWDDGIPEPDGPTGIEAEVCRDIEIRQIKGMVKYGTTVAENPLTLKEWLQHAYEECLDQAVYLKRAIVEIDLIQEGKK